jgi:hypothetical protein
MNGIIRERLSAIGGMQVKRTGDGVMASIAPISGAANVQSPSGAHSAIMHAPVTDVVETRLSAPARRFPGGRSRLTVQCVSLKCARPAYPAGSTIGRTTQRRPSRPRTRGS